MTERELHDIMTYLFADFDAEVKPEKRKVWLDQFQHIEASAGWAAAKLLMSRKSYGLPKAQDFAAALARVVRGPAMAGEEAFQLAYRAAARFGYYREDEGLKSLPPLVAIAARRFGWKALCACESPDLERGHFVRVYGALEARVKDGATLPPALKEQIKHIEQNARKAIGGASNPQPAGNILVGMLKQ